MFRNLPWLMRRPRRSFLINLQSPVEAKSCSHLDRSTVADRLISSLRCLSAFQSPFALADLLM